VALEWLGLILVLQRNFKKHISEPVDLELNKANPKMWDNVLRTFRETLEKAEATYSAKAESESSSWSGWNFIIERIRL